MLTLFFSFYFITILLDCYNSGRIHNGSVRHARDKEDDPIEAHARRPFYNQSTRLFARIHMQTIQIHLNIFIFYNYIYIYMVCSVTGLS